MTYLVYPEGASFDWANRARIKGGLVAGTTSKRQAVSQARKIGGTVELWINGQTPQAIPTTGASK